MEMFFADTATVRFKSCISFLFRAIVELVYLFYFISGLALGLEGSAHGLAIGLTCTRVMN